MATVVPKTVRPGGDYTSLAAFESGEQRDLVAADEIAQAQCGNFEDTTFVDFESWVTDETRYIDVIADDIHGSSGAITTDAYRLAKLAGDAMALGSTMHLHMEGIQVSTPSNIIFNQNGILSNSLIKNCVFQSTGATFAITVSGSASQCKLINCLALRAGGTSLRMTASGASRLDAYNCVFNGNVFFSTSPDTVVIKNSYCDSITDQGVTSLSLVSVASADTSGSPGLQNISQVSAFTDPAGMDFTIIPDGPLMDAGTDTSAEPAPFDFTDDLTQNPLVVRPILNGWDIGAFETPPAPPVASFGLFPLSGNAPLEVEFFNTSTGLAVTYLWDFGDATTSTDESPTHEYLRKGNYVVRLTATNLGGVDFTEETIPVSGPLPILGPIAEPDTWAGKFVAGNPGPQLDRDRQTILDLGFTILDEDSFAGRTDIFAWGPGSGVNSYRGDTLNLTRMPAQFFLIPRGEEITVSLVKAWVPRADSTF